ncbi:MAG: hypothetical protein ACPGXK_17320 [Phycisphaerae bacterium]
MKPPPTTDRWRPLIYLGTLVWGACVVVGFVLLIKYAIKQGRPGEAQAADGQRSPVTLHFFIHPQCPCTAASVEQLDRLMSHVARNTRVTLWGHVATPRDYEFDAWSDTNTVERLGRIPNATLVSDKDAVTAQAYQATTSGFLVVVRDGQQVFRGGLTALRGHAGDSNAWTAALSASLGQRTALEWPVFGCSLIEERPPSEGGRR